MEAVGSTPKLAAFTYACFFSILSSSLSIYILSTSMRSPSLSPPSEFLDELLPEDDEDDPLGSCQSISIILSSPSWSEFSYSTAYTIFG